MRELTALVIGVGPVLAALSWCNLRDRRRDLANRVRARINGAVNRMLGGESLIAVRVEPATRWRVGRVYLSAPADAQLEIAAISGVVLRELPASYDLVVHAASIAGR